MPQRSWEDLVARVGSIPTAVEVRRGSYRQAKEHLAAPHSAMDGSRTYSRSGYFARPLPLEAAADLVRHLPNGRMPGNGRALDFTPWSGAYNRPRPDATAFVHRCARFLLQHSTAVATDAGEQAEVSARRWLDASIASVRPWATGGVYPNFPEPDLLDPGRAYYGTNLERLRRIRARYDPGGALRPVQPHLLARALAGLKESTDQDTKPADASSPPACEALRLASPTSTRSIAGRDMCPLVTVP